jgi:integrase
MPGYIEDRWLKKRPDKVTGQRELTELGKRKSGKRYKVAGIPGVRARSFHRLEDAKKWLKRADTDASRGEFVDPRDGTILLVDYVRTLYRPGIFGAPNSVRIIDNRITHILRELGHREMRGIEAAQLREFIATLLARPLSHSYVRDIMKTLSSILDTAVEDKRILRNPALARSVTVPKDTKERREAWPVERVRAVLGLISARYRVAVAIGAGCGLRQGEVFGLAEEDIDFAAGVVHVRRQVQSEGTKRYYRLPKGDKTRSVDMPDSVAAEIRAHMKQWKPLVVELPWGRPGSTRSQAHALLLYTSQSNAIRAGAWDADIWKPVLAAVGVIPKRPKGAKSWQYEAARRHGFHVLRHTFASVQLEAGESVVTLAKWLGHSSPTVTMDHYAHFLPQAGAKGRAAIDSLLGAEDTGNGSPQRLPRRLKVIDGKLKMQVKRP